MKTRIKIFTPLALFTLACLLFMGCGGDDKPTQPPPPPPATPTFTVSSVNVTLQGGADGLQFFAKPSMDIALTRVDLTNPLGGSLIFNAGNIVVLKEQVVALQDPNTGYVRVSGTWTFRFTGTVQPAGTAFDVIATLNVSADYLP